MRDECKKAVQRLSTALFRLSAGKVATMALLLWVASLPLAGLVLYGENAILGIVILTLGWSLLLASANVAWLSNLVFLYAVFRIFAGHTVVISPLLAVLLSLHTWPMASAYIADFSHGGSYQPVYGYGWGAVLWFSALFFLALSAVMQQFENKRNKGEDFSEGVNFLPLIALLIAAITMAFIGYFSVHDRRIANTAESQRLSKLAFKRGPICSASDDADVIPISDVAGTLELIFEDSVASPNKSGVFGVLGLLDLGIAKIRLNGRDYWVDDFNGEIVVVSDIASTGKPAASLHVVGVYGSDVRAWMIDNSDQRVVFDRSWVLEVKIPYSGRYYCPDFNSHSKKFDPKRLLIKAFNKSGDSRIHIKQSENFPEQKMLGEIMETMDFEAARLRRPSQMAAWGPRSHDGRMRPRGMPNNIGCREDFGSRKGENLLGHPYRESFFSEGKEHYFPHRYFSGPEICSGDFLYSYSRVSAGRKKYDLVIERRYIKNLHFHDRRRIVFPDENAPDMKDMLIFSISHSDGVETIEWLNRTTGEIFVAKLVSGDW